MLAGLKRQGEDRWLIARAPRPSGNRGVMAGVIIQTLILYLVLVGGLAVLLRRITRPLAALTDRVERFGGTLGKEPPLEPSGPEDARRLIAAHNAMEARIAALLDEKDVMLGAIGHDLKTPLAALRVRIESVEDDTERGRMAATIEDITRSLDDILSLARVGRPTDPLERTESVGAGRLGGRGIRGYGRGRGTGRDRTHGAATSRHLAAAGLAQPHFQRAALRRAGADHAGEARATRR